MSLGKLFALLIVLVLAWWVITKSGLLSRRPPEAGESAAPIERARAVARTSADRDAARETAQSAADSGGQAQITENMTPDQVRSLLGPPSETQTETMDSGGTREKWIYPAVGKTVIFENGVVVSIQ